MKDFENSTMTTEELNIVNGGGSEWEWNDAEQKWELVTNV